MQPLRQNLLDELRSSLGEGLHLENVRAMLELSKRVGERAERPLGPYVLASIFGDLDSVWGGRPLSVSQHKAAERELVPLLRRVVFDLQREADDRELAMSLNRLVTRFIELQRSGTID